MVAGRGRRLGALPRDLRADVARVAARASTGPPPWPPRRRAAGARARPARPAARQAVAHAAHAGARATRATRGCGWSSSASPPTRAPTRAARPRRSRVAGYVEHAFGAWHVRGGHLRARRARWCGGSRRSAGESRSARRSTDARARRPRVRRGAPPTARCRRTGSLWNGDAAALDLRRRRAARERSLSGLRADARPARPRRRPAAPHDPLPARLRRGVRRRLRRTAARCASRRSTSALVGDRPGRGAGGRRELVRAGQRARRAGAAGLRGYDEAARAARRRGSASRDRVAVRARRTPADLERETGAVGGAIYGAAPHGRLGDAAPARARACAASRPAGASAAPRTPAAGCRSSRSAGALARADRAGVSAAASGSTPSQVPSEPYGRKRANSSSLYQRSSRVRRTTSRWAPSGVGVVLQRGLASARGRTWPGGDRALADADRREHAGASSSRRRAAASIAR